MGMSPKVIGVCSLLLFALQVLLANDLVLGTWNLKWFPSGVANRRGDAILEGEKIARVGDCLQSAVAKMGGTTPEVDVVLFTQEMRDRASCDGLLREIGDSRLSLVVFSDFRDRVGIPLWQQLGIMSTLPVVESGSVMWTPTKIESIPRGYAYAVLDRGQKGKVLCFCVHFKSNLKRSGDELEHQRNLYKREKSADQILGKIKEFRKRFGADLQVVVAGDFNTDDEDLGYVSEATLRSFYAAHFRSCFTGMRKDRRVTCPGNGRFPDATFDYILYRGFDEMVTRNVFAYDDVSDHRLVMVRIR